MVGKKNPYCNSNVDPCTNYHRGPNDTNIGWALVFLSDHPSFVDVY